MNSAVNAPISPVATMFCMVGSPMVVSFRCSRPMNVGIHSAPERTSTGSTSGPAAGRDRAPDRRPSTRRTVPPPRAGCLPTSAGHRAAADVVVHRPDELVTVAEAFVEVALGQAGLAAHRPNGQCGAARSAEQRDPATINSSRRRTWRSRRGNTRPAAPSLTRGHNPPRLEVTTCVVRSATAAEERSPVEPTYFRDAPAHQRRRLGGGRLPGDGRRLPGPGPTPRTGFTDLEDLR